LASPELIYIDLKDWVGLSKARLGQEAGAYTEALAELRAVVASGRAVVPISSTHYMEISRIASAQRRANLALVMGEVSRYVALTSREVLLRHEFRRSLAQELGVNYAPPPPPVIGFGFGHAFGGQANLRLRGGSADELERFAAEHGDEFIRSVEKQTGYGWRFVPSGAAGTPLELVNEALDATAQFRMLMGPADKQDPDLLKRGFNPAAAYEVVDRITRREADLAAQLEADPQWRRRLDDIIEARALLYDLNEDWNQAVIDVWPRVVTIEEFGMERLHRIIRGIPIVDIESSIRHANFSTGSHKWKKNDIHDSDFAGTAVTYCHVVLTERHLQTQLVRQGIDRKYGTTIVSRPEDLIAHLRRIPQ
jgi:hypothetical protein